MSVRHAIACAMSNRSVIGNLAVACAMMLCALLAGADGRPSSVGTAGAIGFFILLVLAAYLIIREVRAYRRNGDPR